MNPSDSRSVFCENIRCLRSKSNLSLEEMAKLLEIDVPSLRALEDGTVPSQLTSDVVFRISDVFHIAPASLFERD